MGRKEYFKQGNAYKGAGRNAAYLKTTGLHGRMGHGADPRERYMKSQAGKDMAGFCSAAISIKTRTRTFCRKEHTVLPAEWEKQISQA